LVGLGSLVAGPTPAKRCVLKKAIQQTQDINSQGRLAYRQNGKTTPKILKVGSF